MDIRLRTAWKGIRKFITVREYMNENKGQMVRITVKEADGFGERHLESAEPMFLEEYLEKEIAEIKMVHGVARLSLKKG